MFNNPRHPYTKQLLAAEPKGDAPTVERHADHRERRQSKGLVPDQARPLRPDRRAPRRGRRVSLALREARTWASSANPAPEKPRSAMRSSASSARKRRAPSRRTDRRLNRKPCGRSDAHADRLPGPIRLAVAQNVDPEIVEEGLIAQGVKLSDTERRSVAKRSLATPVSIRRRSPIPARILRRSAPAHRDRAGDRLEPEIRPLDEPTSALDLSIPAQIVDFFASCRSEQAHLPVHLARPQSRRAHCLATGSSSCSAARSSRAAKRKLCSPPRKTTIRAPCSLRPSPTKRRRPAS